MFSLENVMKSYGTIGVLDGFSLTVSEGETVSLIGPSGCGKSTILKLLLGLEAPDSGTLTYKGAAITRANAPSLRRRFGYVIQHGGLFPHLSVRDNVALMARYSGEAKDTCNARIAELADLTHLALEQLDKFPGQLSGGQKQRVALMRALMLDPDVLLLDEPLGALDTLVRYDLQQELRSLFDSLNKTVILVTHDMGEAAYLADRIVPLNNGRIEQDGTPTEFLDNPASDFVTAFMTAQRSLSEVVS